MKGLYNLTLIMFILNAISARGQNNAKSQNNVRSQNIFQRLTGKDINDSAQSKSRTFMVPVLGHSPESGYEYGLSGYKNFMLPSNKQMRTSTMTLKASLTTRKSSNFIFDADLWANQNRSHLYAEVRSQKFPLFYYGIGNHQLDADKILLSQRLSHLNLVFEKMILPSFYIGTTILWEGQQIKRGTNQNSTAESTRQKTINVTYFGFGITQSYDTRDNVLYTHSGVLLSLSNMLFPADKGGIASPGPLVEFNVRYFVSPSDPLTIGYDLQYEGLFMKNAPFYLLPQLGNDERMRGYYTGRSRDRQLFTNQVEVRYHFMPRFGLVAFGGLGTTSRGDWSLNQMKSSVGMGIRYFFDLKHDSTIRLDYAVGEKFSHEARQTGYYLTLGEAF